MGLVSKEMIADLIINIINILVLFFLTKALLYKPVKKFLNARRERMEAERQAAAQAQSDADRRKAFDRIAGLPLPQQVYIADTYYNGRFPWLPHTSEA